MADNSPSVELAPLKGSIILNLDQFDSDTDYVEDRIVHLAELFHIALNPHLNIDLDNFNESLSAAQEKIKNFESEVDSINKEIDIKINTDFNESDLATLNKIRGLADDSSDISSNEDENNDNIDPAIFNNSEFDDGIPQGQDNTSHGEQEHRDIEELGDHLFDKGMMLQWTIAPMIDDADKSLIKLGFSTEAAFNLANREFGKNSSIVQQWSKTTAENLGLSSSDALNLADRFGLSARSMGANKSQAADLAEHMTNLADQLSLATGGQISLSQAGQVLTGVMGGQMYGLKQLGVQFSTNQQNAESAALGYGKVYSKLTPLQQAYVNTALLQGSLNDSLGSLSDNLGSNYGQWEKTKAQLQENAETMATDLLPSLIELMHGVVHVVDWFSHLGKAGHLAAGAILLIATAVTPVMLVLGSLIKIVTGTHKVFSKLFGLFKKGAKDTKEVGKAADEAAKHSKGLFDVFKSIGRVILDVSKTFIDWAADAISSVAEIILALDPITLAIGAIVVAVIAAGVEIYEHWKAVKNFFIAMFEDLKKHFTSFKHSIENMGKAVGAAIEDMKNKIEDSIEHLGSRILHVGTNLLKSAEHFGISIIHTVESAIKDIYNKIINNPIIHAILDFDKAALNLISTLIKSTIDIVESMLHFILSWVIYYGEKISDFIGEKADELGHIIENLGKKIERSVTNLFDYLIDKVSIGLSYIKNVFINWCDWIETEISIPINAIKNMAEIMGQSMSYGIEYIVNIFKSGWSDLCEWFAYWVEIPAEKATAGMDHFVHYVMNGIHLAVNGFKNSWTELCGWFDSAVEQPILSLGNTAEQWFSAGENIIESLLQGIEHAFIGVTNYVTSKINSITSTISHAASDVTSWFDGHSADGSHATGLYNVPWDGYRAELHSGEMVLTKDQAEQYRNGTGGANGGVNVTINSLRPLDPFEVKRQMEQYSRNLANGIY